MNIIILQEKLKEGLGIVSRVISKSLSLPVLNNVLIKTKKNFLILSATDLEIGINWQHLAKIEKEGEIILPAIPFFNLISLLPKKQINLFLKDNSLLVSCDKIENQIKIFSSNEFPVIPTVSLENYIELDSNLICEGINQVIDIVSLSQTRPEISGIYFSFIKDTLKIVATDSFRLGEKTLTFEQVNCQFKNLEKQISFILPQKTAREVINIFSEKKEKLRIYFSPNQIMFENQTDEMVFPKIQLISRLIDGEFPAYQEIIPKKYETQIIINKLEFINQIKIAALFSSKSNDIKLKINPKKATIEIYSQNPELGEHKSVIQGKVKGEPLEISFNQKFLLDGLLNIKDSEVIFEFTKEEKPAVLKGVEDLSYIYIVMPIKM